MASDPEQYLRWSLSMSHAEYLLERGDATDPEGFAIWQRHRDSDRMRRERHPDLIVAAFGDYHTGTPGVVEVVTADDARHFVTDASYDARKGLNLLSRCVLVEREPCLDRCHGKT